MKKIKKLMALLMAVAMIMGMTMTAMAAPKTGASLSVVDENGASLEGAELKYVQVIKADPKTATGWAFTTPEIAACYTDAFDGKIDAQAVIKKLINFAEKKADAATTNEIAKALSNVKGRITYAAMSKNPMEVKEAGVYAIDAVQEGYTYNNMAAYVGFGEVKNEYPALLDTTLTAKRAPIKIDKVAQDDNKVVAVGDELTYTITTKVPFIDPNKTDRKFEITDQLTGAKYFFDEAAGGSFKIYLDNNINEVKAVPVVDEAANSFKVDLSELVLTDNANAGKELTIIYKVKVTEVTVENTVGSHISGQNVSGDSDKVYTGTIKLEKYDEQNRTQLLAGAGFEITNAADTTKTPLTFTGSAGNYTYDPNGTIKEVFTGPDGILVVNGLDLGTYNFKEKTAPEGYHIANKEGGVDVSATLTLKEGEKEATAIVTVATELANTKLSSLPSTGGIGTTIFTIAGCVIMIAAAAMFFANRRKVTK